MPNLSPFWMPAAVGALACLMLAPDLAALDPRLRISQYQKHYWQVEQGLPHTYVTAVSQAPDGYLLIGTDEGLARFDGLNFRAMQSDPALGLSRRWISAILIAKDKSTWIGTFDGRIIQIRDGRTEGRHQIAGSVFALIESGDGAIWASTRNGVYRVQNGGLVKVPGLAPPLETSWNVLARDTGGVVWIVTAEGLFSHRNGTSVLHLANGASHGDLLTVCAERGGGLWLGTTTGLFHLAELAGARPVRVAGVPGPVVSLLVDRDGTSWAGTWGQGLYRVSDQQVARWAMRDGLSDDFIRTLGEDNEGNLWIGTRSGGLGRWRETRLVPFGVAEGLAGDYATTVMADPRGNLWLGTWRGGLYMLNYGLLESQPTPLPRLFSTVRALAFDQLGHQWIGNWEGLFEFDGNRYHRYATEAESPYRSISALLFTKDGALWVGTTNRGVYRFSAGRPTDPPPAPLLQGSEITAIHQDTSGTVWIGTAHGLARIPNDRMMLPGFLEDLPKDGIESIFEDSKRRIWASTAGGDLFVISSLGHRILDRRHGLPAHPLYRVLEDLEGTYWVSSPRGVLELSGESVEQVLAGKRTRLDLMTYNQDDGMRTIECHGLSQPAGWRDRDGSLWFPTAKGFVQVRPSKPRTQAPPRVVVEEVTSDALPLRFAGEIDLRAGARNLEIHYTALRLASPGKVQFRYRMSGFDPDWVEAEGDRSARYNQLPPGPHTFEVEGRDPFGAWSSSATILFRQQPRFYQTWWFVLLLGLASVALVTAAYRWRLHSVSSRYAAVMEERNRIGREWHDTLVAGFSAISLQLEAALSRIPGQPARASEILEVTRKMVHHYRAEARRVIWDLRDNRPEGETLPMAVNEALRRVTETRGIEGEVTVEGTESDLPIELQHNVLRICQEAIANAARHGGASRICVTLTFAPGLLTARIRDDGRGFDPDSSSTENAGHYGLMVMQERARRYGGTLRIESRSGDGTSIEASVPLVGVKT